MGDSIELTNREFVLLEFLAQASPKTVSKTAIVEHVWDQHFDGGTNVVNVRSAHRLSLGLEFMLGRQAELESHLRVYKVLYPDDPSPAAIEATQLALRGQLKEAEAQLTNRADIAEMEAANVVLGGFKLLSALSDYVDLDVALGDRTATAPTPDELVSGALRLLLSGSPATTHSPSDIRFPQLPCVKAGIQQAVQSMQALVFGLGADSAVTVDKVKNAWKHLSEGILPLIAASIRSSHQPGQPDQLRTFLAEQAELYQLAAESPSMLPKVRRIGRFLVIKTCFEMAQQFPPAREFRTACIDGVRRALDSRETSATECSSYLQKALQLHDLDLARQNPFCSRDEAVPRKQTSPGKPRSR